MPCSEFLNARPEKSVPPKKSHSWRSHDSTSPERPTRYTLPDSAPAIGENLSMGPSTLRPELQNGDAFRPTPSPNDPYGDAPLDFSLKPESKNRLSEDGGGHPGKSNSFAHPFRIPNGQRNGRHHSPNETRQRLGTNDSESVRGPTRTLVSPQMERSTDYFDAIHPADRGARYSPAERTRSPSPPLQSPSSSSKSPILASMLAGNPPDILSGMTMDALDPRLMPFGVANGYPAKGLCGIPTPNSVMANPAVGNLLVSPFLQSQVNLLPPVSPVPFQAKMEMKPARKAKQERPFKNYDVSLQDDLQCNPLAWTVMPALHPRPVDEGSPPDVPRVGSAVSPNRERSVNGHSESSDPISVTSEFDNAPQGCLPPNCLEEVEKGGAGRKRKPVADSEKDASYWERRKKNNQAAKRSRENRRIKEDTVAQQALYFRSEAARLSQLVLHLNARIHDVSMKCASLEQDKLTLTAENAMFKQSLSQKRCGQCGNPLANKLL